MSRVGLARNRPVFRVLKSCRGFKNLSPHFPWPRFRGPMGQTRDGRESSRDSFFLHCAPSEDTLGGMPSL